MKNIGRKFFATVLLCGGSSIATASVIEFDPTNDGSGVSVDNLDQGCLGFVCSDVTLDFSLNDLDGLSNDLAVGDSWTFDFFDATVDGIGAAEFDLSATLAFESPGGSTTHSGEGGAATLFGTVSGGYLTWEGSQVVNLADGPSYSVALENVLEGGLGDTTTVSATVERLEAVSVPEPGALTLLGAGLLGFGLTRRRKAAMRALSRG